MCTASVNNPTNSEKPENRESFLTTASDPISPGSSGEATDSFRIRSRLLNRLGIEKEHAVGAVRSEPSSLVRLGEQNAFNELLKADHGQPDKCLEEKTRSSACCEESLATSPGKECVLEEQMALEKQTRFDANVKVIPIPSRSQYSDRIRSALWTDATEIQQNAARNSYEFAAEGFNADLVAEEKDMIVYQGELVHPIHFVQECNLNRHFCNAFASQQEKTG